jgi:hypothetical protein
VSEAVVQADAAANEWRREFYTMAFYLVVVLDAALVAISPGHQSALGVIWGTTIGLVLAHLFAFDLAARFVSGGHFSRADGSLASAQLAAGVGISWLASIPLVFFSHGTEISVVRFELAALIGLSAGAVGRSSGASWPRTILFAAGVIVVASVVASVKHALAH